MLLTIALVTPREGDTPAGRDTLAEACIALTCLGGLVQDGLFLCSPSRMPSLIVSTCGVSPAVCWEPGSGRKTVTLLICACFWPDPGRRSQGHQECSKSDRPAADTRRAGDESDRGKAPWADALEKVRLASEVLATPRPKADQLRANSSIKPQAAPQRPALSFQ